MVWSSWIGQFMTTASLASSRTRPSSRNLRMIQLQRFHRNLKKNDEIDNIIYDKINPTGSQPARIYGLPKIHKVQDHSSTPPFRLIVSPIGTHNYNIAKYLCILLNPHIPNDYCACDTFTFVNEVTRLLTLNKFMVSFDVESLFTNIPLIESIDLCSGRLHYEGQSRYQIRTGKSYQVIFLCHCPNPIVLFWVIFTIKLMGSPWALHLLLY